MVFMTASQKEFDKKLTPEEEHVISGKGTETPFKGKYFAFW